MVHYPHFILGLQRSFQNVDCDGYSAAFLQSDFTLDKKQREIPISDISRFGIYPKTLISINMFGHYSCRITHRPQILENRRQNVMKIFGLSYFYFGYALCPMFFLFCLNSSLLKKVIFNKGVNLFWVRTWIDRKQWVC